jgi:hypothetical protein
VPWLEMLKTILWKKKKKRWNNNNNNRKSQQKSNHMLQKVVDYQPGDHLTQGTQTFIPLSVQQKV